MGTIAQTYFKSGHIINTGAVGGGARFYDVAQVRVKMKNVSSIF